MSKNGQNESGVVLLLIALLITSFFILAAFAVDTSVMAISRQQADNFARLTALNALQGYAAVQSKGAADGYPNVSSKIEHALMIANSANASGNAGANKNLALGGSSYAQTLYRDNDLSAPAEAPRLVAGKYYAEKPVVNPQSDTCLNPCIGTQAVPCFVPLDQVAQSCESQPIGNVHPNAFRVQGRLFTDMRTVFARVMQIGSYDLSVDEIASYVPRKGVFLVDISPSSAHETHVNNATKRDFYAYYLGADNATPTVPTLNYDQSWAAMAPDRSTASSPPSPGSPEYSTTHYRSDYMLVNNMLTDANYENGTYPLYHPSPTSTYTGAPGENLNAGTVTGNYRVDFFRDASYTGPDPMVTIFNGLNTAVQEFKERAVAGDQISLVFFDQKLTWPRIINLTSDFDYVQKFTDISDTTSEDRGLKLLLKHGIFPSYHAYSDIQLALIEAMRQFNLSSASSSASVNFIVYMGDGLSNCVIGNCSAVDATGTTVTQCGCTPNTCNNTYGQYKQAVYEMRKFALGTLAPLKIPIHVVLSGTHVGPHTLALSDGSGRCISDTEARQIPSDFTRGETYPDACTDATAANAFAHATSSNPFYEPNKDLYRIARITGGIWGPLKQYDPSCSSVPTTCSSTSPSTAPRVLTTCSQGNSVIKSYIDDIMGTNPYMVVPKSG